MENRGVDNTKKSHFDDLNREELITKCKSLLVIAQKAKQAKSEYQSEVNKYQNEILEYEKEKKDNLSSIKTLQELVDSLTEQKLNYITEIDALHSKLKTANETCSMYEDNIEKFKANIIVKDQQLSTSLKQVSDLDCEIISIKRQHNRLLDENEQLIKQLTDLEASASEFNNIGLQQREQLQLLEQKIQNDGNSKEKITELNEKIKELEYTLHNSETELRNKDAEYKDKMGELQSMYESEKLKKDKISLKFKNYKDKILKCASCINQLKYDRFILTKTVKEYSESIPKWQNEIMKASKILDVQMNALNTENLALKARIEKLEEQVNDVNLLQNSENVKVSNIQAEKQALTKEIALLKEQNSDFKTQNAKLQKDLLELTNAYDELRNITLNEKILANKTLSEDLTIKVAEVEKLTQELNQLKTEYHNLKENEDKNVKENLLLQIKALESEKSILVKEKLNAKDINIELENQNRSLAIENTKLKTELYTIKEQFENVSTECINLKDSAVKEKSIEVQQFKTNITSLQEQYDKLKRDFENVNDMNGLLKEEIDTLKSSLEQPHNDNDNLSHLNESLQADLAKLEAKVAAYKQENASLLSDLKEHRSKVKEYDNIFAEYEDAKSKLLSYKTENAELLNEMKEINQVLKERGETISRLQKAVTEMENLIETLEKERDEKCSEFLNKIDSLETSLKNAELSTNRSNEDSEKLIAERDNATKLLKEREVQITTLIEELEKIKKSYNVELPNEDNMSTSTISKAEDHSRMKDLDETFEDKYTKLRIFALKLKKKLNETTTQLQSSDQENSRLKKQLNEQSAKEKSSEDVVDSVNKTPVPQDSQLLVSEHQEKIQSLSTSLQKAEEELAQCQEKLTTELNSHASTKQQLDKALRDVKKKNVLSLEMEDYEKSLKDLTIKMEEKKKKIVQMESTIDAQEGTITALKTQIKLLEEQIKGEEAQKRSLKEELQQLTQDNTEKDNVIIAKKEVINKLVNDLESEKRKNEDAELEMTTLLSEKENSILHFSEERIELNNKIKKLEFKCADVNEKLKLTNIELHDLKTEYTSYKVRAQAVLRQNQTIDHSQEERLKEETAALKTETTALNHKMDALQNKFTEQSAELEATRKRVAEANAEATRAQQRTARLQTDLTRLSQQLESERTQHKLQISTLTQCYKSQISDLEAKHHKEVDNLRKQLATVQDSVKYGKTEHDSHQDTMAFVPKDDTSDGEMDINVSMIPREEGEGSESAPSPPLMKSFMSGGSRRSPVPLERLLEEGVPEDEPLDTASLSLTPEQEIADLKRKVFTMQQRVKHVTVLLSESERECARLVQLSELLKSELRRVRGSTQNAHNTEYMKNVTLKFLTLPPGDERSRLVPVLQKILTLSTEESQKIQAVAKGLDPNPSKGWGSYLPWPGGK
ncbi:unnamed protein product [Leptosia nina]|uniref:GRIP domain-containing protein n=1 Tax=Leptosia nina TaxID=320188 RepID=A0AAV1JHP0_9NEOP